MSIKVEIENASLDWIDVTGRVVELSDGFGADEWIPDVTVECKDSSLLDGLLDPSVNPNRARLRVTEGDLETYYLIERPQGEVVKSLKTPSVYGRAWAGVLDNLRPASFEWTGDILASTLCAQVAHQDIENQAGITVPVVWEATLDPTIPGGRYSISKKSRREVVAEVAEACGARVRTSLDGLSLEVYDVPDRDLSGTLVRSYTEGIAPLNFEQNRVEDIANAVRVQGEVLDYTRPALPVIAVQVYPSKMDADGDNTAQVQATVYGSSGRRVTHTAVVDEAITAGSYTEIPVSGCYSVQGVWLNTGTAESPVKGDRVTPSSFDASTITVPDNGTQLFIVSYTQAEVVSWSLSDYQDQIDGEAQTTTDTLEVSTDNPIGRIRGVYRASDTNRTGTNYYTGGSATANTTNITLGITPGPTGTAVIIDYDVYNAAPVGASISPASSLCNADGEAVTTIGAGETVGMAVVTASALGQEGNAYLSLTGGDIGGLEVEVDPSVIRAQVTANVAAEITESHGIQYEAGTGYYIDVDYAVFGIVSLTVGGSAPRSWSWTNGATNRITITPPQYTAYTIGTTVAVIFTTREDIEFTDQSAEITATVVDADDDPVTDGTAVKFEFVGSDRGASLSSSQAFTSGGVASISLTSGESTGTVTIRVTAGSHYADVDVKISTDAEEIAAAGEETTEGTEGPPSSSTDDDDDGCEDVQKDSDDESGSICGRRQLVDCDGNPIPNKDVQINGEWHTSNADGWVYFCVGEEGENTVTTEDGSTASFDIPPAGSPGRGEGSFEVC